MTLRATNQTIRLYNATIAVLAEKGYTGTVQDIGNRVGMRKAVVHYYIKGGKTALFQEAWRYYVSGVDLGRARNPRYEYAMLAYVLDESAGFRIVRSFFVRHPIIDPSSLVEPS